MSFTTSNYPPPKPSKSNRTAAIIVAVVLGVLVLLCSGIVLAAVAGSDPEANTSGKRPAVGTTPRPTPAPTTRGGVPDPGDQPAAALTAKDFEASLKIRGKDCVEFDTIPDVCNYQYEVRFLVVDLEAYKRAGDSYSVTYAVKGLKGGEQLDTVEVDGEGNYSTFPGFGTAGPKAKLTVRVVEVEKRP